MASARCLRNLNLTIMLTLAEVALFSMVFAAVEYKRLAQSVRWCMEKAKMPHSGQECGQYKKWRVDSAAASKRLPLVGRWPHCCWRFVWKTM